MPQPPTSTATKKITKASIRNVIKEAPLFAELDDYVLKQAEILTTETAKAGKIKKKKTAEIKQKKKAAAAAEPQTRTTPKLQKQTPVDKDSMLLSVIEMCKLLKISRATLVRMDKSGQIPGRLKIGGSVRFHRETVETWLKSLIISQAPQ